MNRYEQYLVSHKPQIPRVSKDRYPILTRDEAIAQAAELPGLSTSVETRMRWLSGFQPLVLFESRPDGLWIYE